MDLNQFLEWQRARKSRTVTIEIGRRSNSEKILVWAYDYKLQVGQIVQSVDEIDLEGEKTKEEKAQSGTIGGWEINRNNSGVLRGYGAYERLKKKFEDKKSDYKGRKAKSLTRIISLRGEKDK